MTEAAAPSRSLTSFLTSSSALCSKTFTSGSTGFPKGIVHGPTGLLLFAHYTSNYFFNLGPDSTMLCGASSGWINGHTYSIYAPLLHGATSVLVEEPARLSMLRPLTDIIATAQPSILYLPVTTVRILRSISATSSLAINTTLSLAISATSKSILATSLTIIATHHCDQSLRRHSSQNAPERALMIALAQSVCPLGQRARRRLAAPARPLRHHLASLSGPG